jgi:hypothetical protein
MNSANFNQNQHNNFFPPENNTYWNPFEVNTNQINNSRLNTATKKNSFLQKNPIYDSTLSRKHKNSDHFQTPLRFKFEANPSSKNRFGTQNTNNNTNNNSFQNTPQNTFTKQPPSTPFMSPFAENPPATNTFVPNQNATNNFPTIQPNSNADIPASPFPSVYPPFKPPSPSPDDVKNVIIARINEEKNTLVNLSKNLNHNQFAQMELVYTKMSDEIISFSHDFINFVANSVEGVSSDVKIKKMDELIGAISVMQKKRNLSDDLLIGFQYDPEFAADEYVNSTAAKSLIDDILKSKLFPHFDSSVKMQVIDYISQKMFERKKEKMIFLYQKQLEQKMQEGSSNLLFKLEVAYKSLEKIENLLRKNNQQKDDIYLQICGIFFDATVEMKNSEKSSYALSQDNLRRTFNFSGEVAYYFDRVLTEILQYKNSPREDFAMRCFDGGIRSIIEDFQRRRKEVLVD